MSHYRQAIPLFEVQGDLYRASATRRNVAIAFLSAGRRVDATEYAVAALRGFESFGERAEEMIQETQELIEEIQS